ncbi:MAG TPA: preprotein translocase subunit YajC, partial [Xanthobacteraceae bacterium]|nr:preprotein translocase subunit YajC [Xanthobacteraceae bacterium]
MFITPAFAQSGLGGLFGGDSSTMLVQFMPLILIIVIMYFLILRPQQQKVKQHQAMIKALRRGDTVVTNGGLVAKVT